MHVRIVRVGALCAVVGGLLWIYKAGAIMLSGQQPPWAYELASMFFALGLVGLGFCLPRTRLVRAGVTLAVVAGAAAALAVIGLAIRPDLEPTEDTATLLTPFIVLGGMGIIVALALLGIAAVRARVPPPPAHILPLCLAVSIPLLLIVVVVAEVGDRLFELPILVGGFGWVALGIALFRVPACLEKNGERAALASAENLASPPG